jgi:hypothetical protein
MKMRYLTCAETAKLVRKDLKKHFPTIKFSVRSDNYSMGATIRINWDNGPTEDQVSNITDVYESKGFDGMIDLAYYKTSFILPSGEVCHGNSEGTQESGGVYERVEREIPPGAEVVSFGSDYVTLSRHISIEHEMAVAEKLALQHNVKEPIEIAETEYGKYIKYPNVMIWNTWFNSLVHQWFSKVDLTERPV